MNGPIKIYDDKKQRRRGFLLVLMLFVVFAGIAIYQAFKKGNAKEVYLSTQLNGTVTDIYHERGDAYITLSNSYNPYEIENSRNYNYNPKELYAFLKPNDSVVKNACSDTLYIKRDETIYHFLIGHMNYNNNARSKEFKDRWASQRAIVNERNDCKKDF
jgi:hypothetical protein